MIRHPICLVLLICLAATFPIITYASDVINKEDGKVDSAGVVRYDAKLLGVEGKGWMDSESYYDRLPLKAKGMVRKPVWELSHCSAGMQIRFATDAETLQVRWIVTKEDLAMPHMPATGVSGIDLYYRDENGKLRFSGNGRPKEVSNMASFILPPSEEYILYLPLYNGVKFIEFGIPVGKTLSKLSPLELSRSIVFYGTSITQGGCASRPGMATTSIVSRELGVPVINLGFSGNGRMEQEIADLLCDLDPAAYVLDTMWNMKPEMVSERVEPFVKKLRQARPTTPILLVEDSSIDNLPTLKGNILREIYARLTKEGDMNLYFLSNTGMIGEDREATVDGVHFTDLGMLRQATVFIKCVEAILKKQKSNETDASDGK
jgi:hypothetical protein